MLGSEKWEGNDESIWVNPAKRKDNEKIWQHEYHQKHIRCSIGENRSTKTNTALERTVASLKTASSEKKALAWTASLGKNMTKPVDSSIEKKHHGQKSRLNKTAAKNQMISSIINAVGEVE